MNKIRAFILSAVITAAWVIISPAYSEDIGSDDRIILTQKDIRAYNVREIYDLLNRIPGLKASSTSLSIRGATKVKVLVDGRSINDPTSNHGGIRWDLVDLEYVDRILILKSNGGVEYGDDASGGVVDITLKSIDRYQGNLETYGGNHSSFSARVSAQGQTGKFGAGASAGYYETKGFRINSEKRKRQMETRADFAFTPDTRMDAVFSYYDQEKGNSGIPEFPTPYSQSFNDMASGIVKLKHKTLTSKTLVSRANKQTVDPSKQLDSTLEVSEISQELNLPVTLFRAGPFKTGLGYEYAKGDSNQFSAQTEEKAWAYAAKTVKGELFILDLGIRGIYYSAYDNIVNPEIGIGYKKNPYAVRLTVSRTNNVPTFRQKYLETSSTQPNPDLTLEKAVNFGLSFSFTPNDRFSLSLAPFYNRITDRITYVRDDNGIGQYQNFGRVTYAGTDLSLGFKPGKTLTFQSAYTWLITENRETGLELSGKPRHRWVSTLNWMPAGNLSLGLTLRAASSAYTNSKNTKKVSGYGVVDLRTEYTLGGIKFFGELNNILDKTYCLGDGYKAAPLTWILGAAWTF